MTVTMTTTTVQEEKGSVEVQRIKIVCLYFQSGIDFMSVFRLSISETIVNTKTQITK